MRRGNGNFYALARNALPNHDRSKRRLPEQCEEASQDSQRAIDIAKSRIREPDTEENQGE